MEHCSRRTVLWGLGMAAMAQSLPGIARAGSGNILTRGHLSVAVLQPAYQHVRSIDPASEGGPVDHFIERLHALSDVDIVHLGTLGCNGSHPWTASETAHAAIEIGGRHWSALTNAAAVTGRVLTLATPARVRAGIDQVVNLRAIIGPDGKTAGAQWTASHGGPLHPRLDRQLRRALNVSANASDCETPYGLIGLDGGAALETVALLPFAGERRAAFAIAFADQPLPHGAMISEAGCSTRRLHVVDRSGAVVSSRHPKLHDVMIAQINVTTSY
jgi:hypothetical protein